MSSQLVGPATGWPEEWDPQAERSMVQAIRQAGIPAPLAVHRTVPADPPNANADLYYEANGSQHQPSTCGPRANSASTSSR